MLNSEYAPIKQAGNGVQTAFSFSFKILAATDLVCQTVNANGVTSGVLTLGVDYTVVFDPIAESGTVTYVVPPVNGGYSLIGRDSNNQQQTSLPREGIVPAKTIELMSDKAMMLLQEAQAAVAAIAPAANGGQAVLGFIGTTATAAVFAASNPGALIIAVMLDTRTVQIYLGNSTLGTGGFVSLSGF